MRNRFGPSRTEIKLRLGISLAGLAMLVSAYAFNGIGGIASLEIALIGTAFFGGSAVWCLHKLTRKDDP